MGAGDYRDIALSNTETIPGKTMVEFYGVVSGNTVRAKHIGRDIMAGLKNIVGGTRRLYRAAAGLAPGGSRSND